MPVFWNFLLIGFQNNGQSATKRFEIIMAVLQEINKVEVNTKQSLDLITRLFVELPKMSNAQLVDLTEYCIDSIRTGDPKCTGLVSLC